MNPYDVLNVRDNASDMDIKKAYLAYKKRFDLSNYSGDHEYAKKRLEEVEKAFTILSNPQLRSAFDNRHSSHVKSHITKKDVFKEYYQNDPIGTHYHRDYDLAMKKYNANKPGGSTASVTGTMGNSTHTYDTAKNLTSNAFGITGWTFNGWNTQADGKGTT